MSELIKLKAPVSIVSTASAVGEEEFCGPLGDLFDIHSTDGDTFGCDTWEKSESEMQRLALDKALEKVKLDKSSLDCIFAGDLINQCCASSYGMVSFDTPLLGLYGACSTLAEGLLLGSALCSSGAFSMCAAVTSSHNAGAERQFRFPLEYGAQRCPTCQWTVTGAGAFILSGEKKDSSPLITHILPGRPTDAGIRDANNMGAAMAPAAADTLLRYFSDGGEMPQMILTGDLGYEGSEILKDIMMENRYDIRESHCDCGLMIYDREKQDKHAGGSGCGCSAAVLSSEITDRLHRGDLRDVVFVGTGALMSPMSIQQGQSIVGIAHLVRLCSPKYTFNKSGSFEREGAKEKND